MRARRAMWFLMFGVMLSGVSPSPAHAKPPTRKVIVWGDRLAAGIELTDSLTLALSDVFTGNFLGPVRAAPPPVATLPRYEVSFYVTDARGGVLASLRGHRLER